MTNIGDSKLSRKFQVTIPSKVRRLMRLHAGDLLVFVRRKDEVVLKRGIVKIQD